MRWAAVTAAAAAAATAVGSAGRVVATPGEPPPWPTDRARSSRAAPPWNAGGPQEGRGRSARPWGADARETQRGGRSVSRWDRSADEDEQQRVHTSSRRGRKAFEDERQRDWARRPEQQHEKVQRDVPASPWIDEDGRGSRAARHRGRPRWDDDEGDDDWDGRAPAAGKIGRRGVGPPNRRVEPPWESAAPGGAPPSDAVSAEYEEEEGKRYRSRRGHGREGSRNIAKPSSPEEFAARLEQLNRRYKRKKRWLETLEILDTMSSEGFALEREHYAAALATYLNCRQWERVIALFEEMCLAGFGLGGVAPCFAAISAFRDGSAWESALDLFREAGEQGLERGLLMYTAAIGSCQKSGRWEHALALLDDVGAACLEADVVLYSSVMSACEKGGDVDTAQILLVDMWRSKVMPNEITYNTVIRAFGNVGRWQEAMEMVLVMDADNVMPSVVTFNSVIAACKAVGNFRSTIQMLKVMRKRDVKPNMNTYIDLVDAAETAEQWQVALAFLQKAVKAGLGEQVIPGIRRKGYVVPKAVYQAALLAAQRDGRWEQVLGLFAQMQADGYEARDLDYLFVFETSLLCTSPVGHQRLKQVLRDGRAALNDASLDDRAWA
mmetsp:Transcript_85672/g.239383  ORF Transcript_85672/g.239383 Transcript_85672/m.239383 type:complete len:609 (-) Transcript_85672:22-1848(-)